MLISYYSINFIYSEEENKWEPTIALGSIKKVREEITSFNQQLSKVKDRVYTFVLTGVSHTECKYLYLFSAFQEKYY